MTWTQWLHDIFDRCPHSTVRVLESREIGVSPEHLPPIFLGHPHELYQTALLGLENIPKEKPGRGAAL